MWRGGVRSTIWLMSQVGRVGMWRGGVRSTMSVAAPFVWRCLRRRANSPASTRSLLQGPLPEDPLTVQLERLAGECHTAETTGQVSRRMLKAAGEAMLAAAAARRQADQLGVEWPGTKWPGAKWPGDPNDAAIMDAPVAANRAHVEA
jgi:hypothetical protein